MASEPSDTSAAWENLKGLLSRAVEDVDSQAMRNEDNLGLLKKFTETYLANGLIDDRTYLYEDIIRLAASLPNGSGIRDDLSSQFIKTLWDNLQHPPISYLGDKFKYRTADGSYNNIMYPQLGAAGSNYARTVTPKHQHTRILPDPGVIFDTVLARSEKTRPHPNKVSSTLFYFATIIIHDIFRTSEVDSTVVKSSSYLDLGPLYGHNQDEQDQVRTFKDGLLKKDAFSEYRILAQPPGVGALLVAFNRFHNWVAGELATINENGKFGLPPGLKEGDQGYEAAEKKRDNDLFQTSRLVTCGLYVNIILNDYLRTILNLNDNPYSSDWRLDPREAFQSVYDPQGTPRGIGNQVSAEFNFIYRWHAAVSDRDEVWLKNFTSDVFGAGVDPDTLSTQEFLGQLKEWFHTKVPRDPAAWTFGGLKRKEDGGFDDSNLVELLKQGTETVAGAFGARNIPKALKAIEVLGIQQGRDWGIATLNEFRQFFKLKPFKTFEEVNSAEPGVAEALEALYGHPDNIELYPGLMAEQTKKVFAPGSGFCPGFTISEAILSDAVALVRGDRFYAQDYGPRSLTSFGFTAASSDFDIAGGGVMYKLLQRAFPGWYRASSVYALYPFSTPGKTKEIFSQKNTSPPLALDYTPPVFIGPPIPVTSWEGVIQLLHDQENFKVPWGPHTYQLTGHDYMLSGDKPINAAQRVSVKGDLYSPNDTLTEVRNFYESVTARLIREKTRKLGNTYQIDIVQDIGNLAHAEFCGRYFGIPLRLQKSAAAAHAPTPFPYTPGELYDVLSRLFEYVFLDLDTAKSLKHLIVSSKDTAQLGDAVRGVVKSLEGGLLEKIHEFLHESKVGTESTVGLEHFGREFVKRLIGDGHEKTMEDVVWTLIPTAAAACATQAQAWAQLVDVYLSDEYLHHWAEIERAAWSDEPEAFEILKKYALEGFRLFPAASGVLRVVASPTPVTIPSAPFPLPSGASVFADFITASRDPTRFPDPEEIKLDRPYNDYIHHGWGPHSCLGRPIVETAAAAMLRQFARGCHGLRRAPGNAGEMKRKLFNGAFPVFLAQDGGEWNSFPVAKKVFFDGLSDPDKGLATNGKL